MTWPYYLTTSYNDSLLQTYCLAKSGSTVDHAILPHGNSFTEQMSDYWLPKYSKQWDMYDLAATSSEIRLDDYSTDNIVEKRNHLAGNKKVQETIEEKSASKWSSSTSLFAVFFGVNDVIVTLEDPLKDQELVFNAIFVTYKRLLRQVKLPTPSNNLPNPTSSTKPVPATSSSSTFPQSNDSPKSTAPKPSNAPTP